MCNCFFLLGVEKVIKTVLLPINLDLYLSLSEFSKEITVITKWGPNNRVVEERLYYVILFFCFDNI